MNKNNPLKKARLDKSWNYLGSMRIAQTDFKPKT